MTLHANLPESHARLNYDALSYALALLASRHKMIPLTGFPQTPLIHHLHMDSPSDKPLH